MKKYYTGFAVVAIITVLFGSMYAVGQQSLRLSANDPQLQLADDAAAALKAGKSPDEVVSGQVDIATSLAPFVIIYTDEGKVVTGSGFLDGVVPTVPYGVLTHALPGADNIITWQPRPGVRVASVSASAGDYYVLSGRSLREVEHRADTLFLIAAPGWLVCIAILLGYMVASSPKMRPTRKKSTTK